LGFEEKGGHMSMVGRERGTCNFHALGHMLRQKGYMWLTWHHWLHQQVGFHKVH
jgi:hypothetical protein